MDPLHAVAAAPVPAAPETGCASAVTESAGAERRTTTHRITVDLPEAVAQRLHQVCDETGQSKSFVVRTSLNLTAVVMRKAGEGFTELVLRNPVTNEQYAIPLELTGM